MSERYPGVTFYAPDKVEIQEDVEIGSGSRVGTYVVILKGSRIGRDCTIGSFVHIAGARIGDRVSIQTNVHVTRHTQVESDVFLGPGVLTTNDKQMNGQDLKGPHIGAHSRIGAGAILLPVRIGAHVVVGAGAVVNKPIPDGVTVAGVPARPLQRSHSDA